ncbi:MAG: hypothetical protein C4529_07015 [Deltaproteobacteria bacterium]|nr:MAG: hypothetical protein C4529_07015 [Deltaproteobacteria bacterium]
MYATLVTAPASLPVTLAEAKSHLRVEVTDDDTLISTYIEAATGAAEEFLRRRLVAQTWRYFLDEFPGDGSAIVVPGSPLVSVAAFTYRDPTTGTPTTVPGTDYSVEAPSGPNPPRGRLVLGFEKSWPTARAEENSVQFDAVLGYGGLVPLTIKAGILHIIGSLYANREAVVTGTIASKVPQTAEFLLSAYRLFEFK